MSRLGQRNSFPLRRGFTLIELVASMTIGAILLSGMGSAILIASHALPGQNTATDAILRASDVVQQMAGELHCAVTFTQRSATVVEITVPDRDADLALETIRYAWSGTPGDPLTRQYNAGTIVNVAEDVQEFDLGYVTRIVTTKAGDILLASFERWAGMTETPQHVPVNLEEWAAAFCLAAGIPNDASKVTITRVLLKMRQGSLGSAGAFTVAIHKSKGAGNPEPVATPIGTPVVGSGANLSGSYRWEEFKFSDVTVNNANKEYVIVVKGTAVSGTQGDVEVLRYYVSQGPKIDSNALWTSNAGTKWWPKKTIADEYQFPFYVYGEYQSPASRYSLDSVGIKLRLGMDARTRVQTAAQVLNKPEVTGP